MKFFAINGSPKDASTAQILNNVLEGIKSLIQIMKL